MTPARAHRERMAALAAQRVDPKPAVSSDGGGQPAPAIVDRTPAMIHREQVAATAIVTAPDTVTSAEDRIAAQIVLRLTHDLRRLKEIKSIDLKIAAKREMLPEYRAWIEGILAADAGVGTGLAAEVVPTCMVWLIDVGNFDEALTLAEFVLRHRVAMPSRYQRDAATIIVEEIADAALKAQNAGNRFSLETLGKVVDLTFACDIHDEVRAKLLKAIGNEELAAAEAAEASAAAPILKAALSALNEAQRLHDRVGVKDKIKRATKLLAAITAADAPDQNNEQGGQQAA